jgi:NarL family two-component system response regulator LiaR
LPSEPSPHMSRPIDLAVVNDYELVTAGVAAKLLPYRSRVRVHQLVDAEPLAGLAQVALFDTFANPRPGLKLDRLLAVSGLKVIVWSWALNQREHALVLRQGASGYVSKAATSEEIVTAVERVAAGGVVRGASSSTKRHMVAWPGQAHGLSPRESEVVALIASGCTDEEIAETLYLRLHSVQAYVRSGYAKMGVDSRSTAVRWALENGLDAPAVAPPMPLASP